MSKVFQEDLRVVLNKLLKGLLYALVAVAITLIGQYAFMLPTEYAILGVLLVPVLETFKKSIEEYKSDYNNDFKWFWQKVAKIALKE